MIWQEFLHLEFKIKIILRSKFKQTKNNVKLLKVYLIAFVEQIQLLNLAKSKS